MLVTERRAAFLIFIARRSNPRSAKVMSRIINSWNFPEGLFMKALATRLYDRGLRGNALVTEFENLVPHWKSYFGKPISDGAIAQRADKARRYENENPETHPRMKKYWRAAGPVARNGKRLSKKTIASIVRRCSDTDAR
jgi:hypothetical protein